MLAPDEHLTSFTAAQAHSFHDAAVRDLRVALVVDSSDHAKRAVDYFQRYSDEYAVPGASFCRRNGEQSMRAATGGGVEVFSRKSVMAQIRGFSLDAIYLPYDMCANDDLMMEIIPALHTSATGRIITY